MTTPGPVIARWLATSRAREWWEYKLLPTLGAFYATALHLELDPRQWLVGVLVLLGALVPGAVFVSVVNDLTDRADDAAAGKTNRMANASRSAAFIAVGLPVAIGVAWGVAWLSQPLLAVSYAAAWAAFALYSVPPFRLKRRGWAGVLADASGAHLFPTVVASAVAFAAANRAPEPMWIAVVGCWALAYGLRGIVWHQLSDRVNDRASGVETLAVRHAPEVLRDFARYGVFPVELGALLVLLGWLSAPLAWLSLTAYAIITIQQLIIWKINVVLVEPKPSYHILLADFYDVLLPLALLASLMIRNPAAGGIGIALHLALFHARARSVLRDIARIEITQLRIVAKRFRA